MAPPSRERESSIDRTSEYEQFIKDVAAYHVKRGTNFEPEPRVGSRHVDLLRLFRTVVARGGYDAVSGEKLAWRKLGQEFNLGHMNLPALAFNLKTTYYKNLAAYEISTVHGKEPPPKEILENLSARGGDLLNRTLENYRPHGNRDQGHLGDDLDGAGYEEQKTPGGEKSEAEDAATGGRLIRGLRQAPAQRVLFQPDLTPARQARPASAAANADSPQPTGQPPVSGTSTAHSAANTLLTGPHYEPTSQRPLALRPVNTPANNPALFEERLRALRLNQGPPQPSASATRAGFDGPNVYVRILNGLRSGLPDEQDYALHHLVKISHERGDKYKFDAFPGLVEGLLEKVFEIGALFYDQDWSDLLRDEGPEPNPVRQSLLESVIKGLDKMDRFRAFEIQGNFESTGFGHAMCKINEACLVLRNMVMLDENAEYVSHYRPMRDFIAIVLHLPRTPVVIELQHYALEIAEQLTRYYSMDHEEPLYRALLAQLATDDRGLILTGLRAITRISMSLEESNRLKGVSPATVENICNWLLLEDDDLVHACLDFLYQYTADLENIETMLKRVPYQGMIDQLVRFLLRGAREVEYQPPAPEPVPEPEAPKPAPEDADAQPGIHVPQSLFDMILAYEEPERSSHWLRACFEEDPNSDITQIKIWQAYQFRFSQSVSNDQLLPAADFIKNVSVTFPAATAQVLTNTGGQPRFIIRGIRWREAPMDPERRIYQRCEWRIGEGVTCGQFILETPDLWDHIVGDHLGGVKNERGRWDKILSGDRVRFCQWSTCKRYQPDGTRKIHEVAMHVKAHLPETYKVAVSATSSQTTTTTTAARQPGSRPTERHVFYDTSVDERGDAAGLPLAAVLVLRNLARNLPRLTPPSPSSVGYARAHQMTWTARVFTPVMSQLWHVTAHNRVLAVHLAEVMGHIIDAEPLGSSRMGDLLGG